jgi:hypothetical protein
MTDPAPDKTGKKEHLPTKVAGNSQGCGFA